MVELRRPSSELRPWLDVSFVTFREFAALAFM
jgi:hypothetical protein